MPQSERPEIPMTRASQSNRALAAVLDGANTSSDIADALGLSIHRAGIVLWKLRRGGYVRHTGRVIPSSTGRGGQPSQVYEACRET